MSLAYKSHVPYIEGLFMHDNTEESIIRDSMIYKNDTCVIMKSVLQKITQLHPLHHIIDVHRDYKKTNCFADYLRLSK
jgi:hypothetical protein